MPTCALVQQEQAFAIPVSNQFQLREPAKYLQPLMQLCCVAKELIKVLYGTKYQIQAVAIVERPKENRKETEWEWWLVLSLASPQSVYNFKNYLRTRVPLDLEGMTTLTPWLQRRLGWGDARTTPELLEALKEEARMRPRNLGELCGLLSARRDVAKAELRLRQPRATADPGHPILRTYVGELALLARKQGIVELLDELQQASTSFPALPGPTPLLALDNGALAVGQAGTIDAGLDAKVMWTEVSHRLARRDLAPLASVCQLTREVYRKLCDQ